MSLPNEVIAKIKNGIANYDSQIANIKAEIARAKLIGVDTAAMSAAVVNLENQVRLIKQQYATELGS